MTDTSLQKMTDRDVAFSEGGAELTNLDGAYRLAQWVEQSGMAPQGMKAASIVVAFQLGAELGLKPMQSLKDVVVIHGSPSLRGTAILKLIRQSGLLEEDIEIGSRGEGEDRVGFCRSKRKGWKEPRETTFSWKEAVAAGLLTNKVYAKFPGRMLAWRSLGHHASDNYSDATSGYRVAEDVMPHETRRIVPEPAPVQAIGMDPILEAVASDGVVESWDVQETTEEAAIEIINITCAWEGCTETDLEGGHCAAHFDAADAQGVLL